MEKPSVETIISSAINSKKLFFNNKIIHHTEVDSYYLDYLSPYTLPDISLTKSVVVTALHANVLS